MIYLDNAATTMMKPPCMVDAVTKALTTMGNASRGAHETSLSASRVIFHARKNIAELFNCKRPDHVIFTSNATEALNIAIRGAIKTSTHVITTVLEHNSVLRPLYLMEKEKGISLFPDSYPCYLFPTRCEKVTMAGIQQPPWTMRYLQDPAVVTSTLESQRVRHDLVTEQQQHFHHRGPHQP